MIKDVHFAYQKAHQAILKLGYWKFLLTPIFLSAALALILKYIFIPSMDENIINHPYFCVKPSSLLYLF